MSAEDLKEAMHSAKSAMDNALLDADGKLSPLQLLKTAYSKNITIEEWNQLVVNLNATLSKMSANDALVGTMYRVVSKLYDDFEAIGGMFGDRIRVRYGYVTTLQYDSERRPLGVETTLSMDQSYYLITKGGSNLTDDEYRDYVGRIIGGESLVSEDDLLMYQCIVFDSSGNAYRLRKEPEGQVRAYTINTGTSLDFVRLGTTIDGTVDIN